MTANEPSPRRRAGRIKDARGRKVRQLDPVALHLLRRHNVIDSEALHAIVSEKGVKIAVAERTALIGGLFGALLAISFLTYALITGDIRNAPFPTGLLYLCALPWIIWYGIKKKRFGNVAAAMLKHLRCPHCGYDLRLLQADPSDGVMVS